MPYYGKKKPLMRSVAPQYKGVALSAHANEPELEPQSQQTSKNGGLPYQIPQEISNSADAIQELLQDKSKIIQSSEDQEDQSYKLQMFDISMFNIEPTNTLSSEEKEWKIQQQIPGEVPIAFGPTNLLFSLEFEESCKPLTILTKSENFLKYLIDRKSCKIGQSGVDYIINTNVFTIRGRIWIENEGTEFLIHLLKKSRNDSTIILEGVRTTGDAWVFSALWEEYENYLQSEKDLKITLSRDSLFDDDETVTDDDLLESDEDDESEVDLDVDDLLSPGELTSPATSLSSVFSEPPPPPGFRDEKPKPVGVSWDLPLSKTITGLLNSRLSHQRYAVTRICDALETEEGLKYMLEATKNNLSKLLCEFFEPKKQQSKSLIKEEDDEKNLTICCYDPFLTRNILICLIKLNEKDTKHSAKFIKNAKLNIEKIHKFWSPDQKESTVIPSREICRYAEQLLNDISKE